MTVLQVRSPKGVGRLAIGETPLGKGGEGSVYAVEKLEAPGLGEAKELVAKIYHEPEAENRAAKVTAMIKQTPESESLAWPTALLVKDGKFQGYLMPKLAFESYRPWAELSNAKARRANAADFDLRYSLVATRNLAEALHSVHLAGHAVGDVNESNVFCSVDSSVMIVDTDSAQISSPNGKVFPCPVGKPEYTAAELTHGSLRDQRRTEATDAFAFAVMCFQMLTGGAHPMDGAFKGDDDPPSVTEKIREGILPTLRDERKRGFFPVARIPAAAIPGEVRSTLVKLLAVNPAERPKLSAVVRTFDEVADRLVQCTVNKSHWYDSADGTCGWCAAVAAGAPDPWGEAPKPRSSGQKKLTPLAFSDSSEEAPVPRAAPRRAPVQNSAPRASARPQSSGWPSSAPTPPRRSTNQPGYVPAPVPPAPRQAPPEPEPIPETIRGKMTVAYADGSYGPRPSRGVLFKQSPKLAVKSIFVEIPDLLKFWWPQKRKLVSVLGLLLVVLGGAATAAWSLLPLYLPELAPIDQQFMPLIFALSQLGALTSGLMVVVLFLSALVDRIKTGRRHGVKNFKPENPALTGLRFLAVGLAYGLLIPYLMLNLAILMVKAFVTDAQRQRYRR